ncbi:MAG: response regulator [Steroidobacteraceae bacterium]|jgi:CheY-like chemotaxis protein
MTARRALVVDDSRSARAFLTRILERYELSVDGVESAEQAIQYLKHKRPDVIFMDHLMPGMDGFQAVQAIKNNPRTATIPIMMYTSQEGELYLSQARALGAIGVLPKQIKHADVSKALEQLNLVGETPLDGDIVTLSAAASGGADAATAATHADSAVTPVPAPEGPPPGEAAARSDVKAPSDRPFVERRSSNRPELPAIAPELRKIVDAMVSHHMFELRRFMIDNLESQADRIVSDVRVLVEDQPAAPESPRVPAAERGADWGVWLGILAIIAAAILGVLWQREHTTSATLSARLAQSQQQLTSAQQELQSLQAADAAADASAEAAGPVEDPSANLAPGNVLIEPVPFGETPLAGSRLERIQSLLQRLNSQGFHGAMQIRSIPGRYCMTTPSTAQPVMAAEAMPYARCDQVGNPREDNGSVSLRQSVAFANMIAIARESSKGAVDIQISAGGADETITPYPPVSEGLTAGDWNRVAAANNRVEVRWQATR